LGRPDHQYSAGILDFLSSTRDGTMKITNVGHHKSGLISLPLNPSGRTAVAGEAEQALHREKRIPGLRLVSRRWPGA
jgi:hypothetical protein